MKYFILLLLLSLTSSVYSLMVVIEKGKEFCINKEADKETLKLSFQCSGEREDAVYVMLKDNKNKKHYENTREKGFLPSGDFAFKVPVPGTYYLCFSTSMHLSTVVTFDFYTQSEKGHLVNLAKDEVLEEVYKNVTVVGSLFEEVEKNMKYYVDRKETHTRLIDDLLGLIEKLTIFKSLVIVALSVGQVYLIKKLFRTKYDFVEQGQTISNL